MFPSSSSLHKSSSPFRRSDNATTTTTIDNNALVSETTSLLSPHIRPHPFSTSQRPTLNMFNPISSWTARISKRVSVSLIRDRKLSLELVEPVPSTPASLLLSSSSTSQIFLETHPNLATRTRIRAGTFAGLVSYLIQPSTFIDLEYAPLLFSFLPSLSASSTPALALAEALIAAYAAADAEGDLPTSVRVAKCMVQWASTHWDAMRDADAEEPLRTFALSSLRTSPHAALTILSYRLTSALDALHLPAQSNNKRITPLHRALATAQRPACPVDLAPVRLSRGPVQLAHLRTPEGRWALAHHLTARAQQLYIVLDPRSVVLHFRGTSATALHAGVNAIRAFEAALGAWVAHSVVPRDPATSPRHARQAFKLWIGVAKRCMFLQNDACAHAIFTALAEAATAEPRNLRAIVRTKKWAALVRDVNAWFAARAEVYLDSFAGPRPALPSLAVVQALVVRWPVASALEEDQMVDLAPFREMVVLMRALENAHIIYALPTFPSDSRLRAFVEDALAAHVPGTSIGTTADDEDEDDEKLPSDTPSYIIPSVSEAGLATAA